VRRWHPETLDCAVHTGHRRVSSGLAGPHPDLRTREVARPRNQSGCSHRARAGAPAQSAGAPPGTKQGVRSPFTLPIYPPRIGRFSLRGIHVETMWTDTRHLRVVRCMRGRVRVPWLASL
jgi:hypothetical protein